MGHTLTGPKLNKDSGHGDTKYHRSEVFNVGLARSGVWWAGTPKGFTTHILFPGAQVIPLVPHWLSTRGYTIFPDLT